MTDKKDAERMFDGLRQALAQKGDELEDGVEVTTGDGVHHFVAVAIHGRSSWMDAEEARYWASELLSAAAEADSKDGAHVCDSCADRRRVGPQIAELPTAEEIEQWEREITEEHL